RVMKRSGIGNQRGVNALSNLFRDANTGCFAEVVDHLADCGGSRVDPVDAAEQCGGRVVVDIDDELFLEIREPGPRDVGTLDYEHCMVRRIDCGSDAYVTSARQLLISMWHWIAHDHFDIFIERAQQPVKTE